MIDYTTYRINNELNHKFSFISFNIGGLSLLKSVFNNLFSVKTLQIQFYNFQGKNVQKQNQSQTEQEQDNKGKKPFSIQLIDSFVKNFDAVLFSRDFKIYI
ncbi:hypothetical protein Fleli_0970 [Bernardetia litoralis DSM 6794]|uniref:Uncharacterized protein n=1 Tax=Bernardetia litoralis (strain ATCC 23117 / DSM 6794 / NBRC 15988 / NCIMB 1366 / Fx l1 / Sio-4) TaxID=880071 RepID=I4AHI5_BERLS|nr:hypothetical protein [Bernardetia litoralis]AFM03420.1 hypothetical protein Fleli_0970 [Bernardetia litoralis DSM 6794]